MYPRQNYMCFVKKLKYLKTFLMPGLLCGSPVITRRSPAFYEKHLQHADWSCESPTDFLLAIVYILLLVLLYLSAVFVKWCVFQSESVMFGNLGRLTDSMLDLVSWSCNSNSLQPESQYGNRSSCSQYNLHLKPLHWNYTTWQYYIYALSVYWNL